MSQTGTPGNSVAAETGSEIAVSGAPLSASPPDPRPDGDLKLSPDDANLLIARLSALARTARIFGSALSGVDVQVSWSLRGGPERVIWSEQPGGRRSANIRLDLNRVVTLLGAEGREGQARYSDIFKTGFLHELGHILYSSATEAFPGEKYDARLLDAIWHTLEDARIERRLMRTFRGARRYLDGHPERMVEVARESSQGPVLAQLVAVLFLQIWGAEDRIDSASLPSKTTAVAERLRDSLRGAVEQETSEALASWVREQLLPVLDDLRIWTWGSVSSQPGRDMRAKRRRAKSGSRIRPKMDFGAGEGRMQKSSLRADKAGILRPFTPMTSGVWRKKSKRS